MINILLSDQIGAGASVDSSYKFIYLLIGIVSIIVAVIYYTKYARAKMEKNLPQALKDIRKVLNEKKDEDPEEIVKIFMVENAVKIIDISYDNVEYFNFKMLDFILIDENKFTCRMTQSGDDKWQIIKCLIQTLN